MTRPFDATQTAQGAGTRKGTCAVVVTYRPDIALLREAIEAIRPQVGHVVIVDNASSMPGFDAFAVEAAEHGCELVVGNDNRGLAAGFNTGIARARAAGATHVLLLDQDSVASPAMVGALLQAHRDLSQTHRIAAVGAQFVDPRDGDVAPFVRIGFPFNRKKIGGARQRIECDFLISSGCLIPLSVIDDVGEMDASLFIDNVDLDWCFRAKHAGYRLFGICDARMQHSIGESVRTSRLTRTPVFIHRPARLYYLMRNRLLLYRRRHTPATWIAQDVPRLVAKFIRMGVFIGPRLRNAKAMLRGILDGVRGRSGVMTP